MADILKPELLWIEGRCYRVTDRNTEITSFQEHDLYENEVQLIDEDMDDQDEEFEVTMLDNSRYATYFHVSKHYVGSIIGKKGIIKSRIERDTNTNIKIPRQGDTGDICVLGPTEANVRAATRRINMIVMSSRMKQRPTHFLSIPMNNSEIRSNFELFKEKVLKECPSQGIEESIFIRAEKLHLTMGVMCLMDNEERLLASKLLTEAKQKIIVPILKDHLPMKVRLRGLSYMNDDPKQIKVLYGRVSEDNSAPGVLQNLADSLLMHYYKAGFMDKDHGRDNIKLHVTLMNSKYRNQTNNSGDSRNVRWEPFDGSQVLNHFSDFDFGVMEITEIHLSQRHALSEDGFMDKDHGRDNIKLHVTLMNSKYRNQTNNSGDSRNVRWEPFDGSQVLNHFSDFDFGVMEITEIHLSQRHALSEDGYYQPTCIVSCYNK